MCAAAGFDGPLLDLEHGAGGEEQVRLTVPIAASYGVPTVVRVESDARIRIGRVLDAGAAGVMLPRLDTAMQVRAAVPHLYYPPRGDRGVATYNRACRFGLDAEALDRANDEVVGIVQIESARAVAAAEEIASIDGVDVLFVGPRDLSHDLGVPGQLTAPEYLDAIEQVRSASRNHGKAWWPARERRRQGGREGVRRLVVRDRRVGFDAARRGGDRTARAGTPPAVAGVIPLVNETIGLAAADGRFVGARGGQPRDTFEPTRFSAALARAASSTSRVCTACSAGTGNSPSPHSAAGEPGVEVLVGALFGGHRLGAGGGVEDAPALGGS